MRQMIWIGLFMLIATTTFAAKGSTGCGPGKILLPGKSIVSQTFAMFINVYFNFTASTAVTSQTSECEWEDVVETDQEKVIFVHMNFPDLQEEAAKGEGPHLVSLAQLMGCNEQGSNELQRFVKNHYPRLFIANPENRRAPILWNQIQRDFTQAPHVADLCSPG
ncbi:MAG: DUF3015 family protein [SAR324 cluster bacterium]|nr:DUF3015 family protein [SAR324 cluster bacterium]